MKLALALLLVLAAPVSAAELPDLTVSASRSAGTDFDLTITTTNLGSTGKAQVSAVFTTYYDVISVSPGCYVDTTLVRMRRQQVGVICNHVLEGGASVSDVIRLHWKGLPFAGPIVVNRNHNIELESDYTNNTTAWPVAP